MAEGTRLRGQRSHGITTAGATEHLVLVVSVCNPGLEGIGRFRFYLFLNFYLFYVFECFVCMYLRPAEVRRGYLMSWDWGYSYRWLWGSWELNPGCWIHLELQVLCMLLDVGVENWALNCWAISLIPLILLFKLPKATEKKKISFWKKNDLADL